MKRLIISFLFICSTAFATLPVAFQKTVAAIGTPEKLQAAFYPASEIIIQALTGNTSALFVQFVAANGSPGIRLVAGGHTVITAQKSSSGATSYMDLSKIWIDVGTNGDGVDVTVLNP